MLIGIDGREMEGKPTGVGVYLRNILERLSLPPQAQLLVYFKTEIPQGLPSFAEPVLLKSGGSNLFWQQVTLCRELKRRNVALFFSPANSAPWHYRGINVVTIHDLSFFRFPQWFSARERLSRQLNTSYSLRQADRIYVVSPYVREELMARFSLHATNIVVTPNGVTPKVPDTARRQALREARGWHDAPLLLYAGTVLNRRRLPLLIEAVGGLAACRLVIIGANRTYPHQDLASIAGRAGVKDRVTILEYVSDTELDEYYRMADVFVYLSEYEGFGIPPLEAMSYGIPCVLSATPHMDMIFQDAACFVRSLNVDEVRHALQECLQNESHRERLTRAGEAMVQRYSWDQPARIISEDWEYLLGDRR